jgi:hypothetical protein
MRLRTDAYLGNTRIPITVDLGFGDALGDPSYEIEYGSLLDFPAASIRAYSPATVIAEKFQALVVIDAEAAMGQRPLQQRGITELVAEGGAQANPADLLDIFSAQPPGTARRGMSALKRATTMMLANNDTSAS